MFKKEKNLEELRVINTSEDKIKKEEKNIKKKEGGAKKRGRKPKDERRKYEINKEQTKFMVDLSKDQEDLEMVFNLLEEANKKDYGKELTYKDISLFAVKKLTPKDFEKIKEESLSYKEKIRRMFDEHNEKNNSSMDFDEFLAKKLNLS